MTDENYADEGGVEDFFFSRGQTIDHFANLGFTHGKPLSDGLFKSINQPERKGVSSNQEFETWEVPHPLDRAKCISMRRVNPYHSSCLLALRNFSVGLGHKNAETAKKLNPLCRVSWQDTLQRAMDDMLDTGDGYIEVVREDKGNPASPVAGLFWVPSETVTLFREGRTDRDSRDTGEGEPETRGFENLDDVVDPISPTLGESRPEQGGTAGTGIARHWRQSHVADRNESRVGDLSGDAYDRAFSGLGEVAYAEFGDLERFNASGFGRGDGRNTELLRISLPTNMWDDYGAPMWLAAMGYMELVRQQIQQHTDLFHNRGIPDFLMMLFGVKLSAEDKAKMDACVNAASGQGNAGKSGIFGFTQGKDRADAKMFRLGLDQRPVILGEGHDSAAQAICSAHRVPPILASIMIPGKLGAANEIVSALMMFEMLVVAQLRAIVTTALAGTLGADPNSDLNLGEEAFEFKKVMEEMDIAALNVMTRSRTEVGKDPNRDPRAGTQR